MFCKLHHSTRVPNLCSSGLICKSTKSGLTTWEDMTLTQIKVGTCSVKTRSWRKSLPYLNSVPGTWNNEQSTHPPEVFLGLPTIWQNLHTLTKQKKKQVWPIRSRGLTRAESFVFYHVKLQKRPEFAQWPHQMWDFMMFIATGAHHWQCLTWANRQQNIARHVTQAEVALGRGGSRVR